MCFPTNTDRTNIAPICQLTNKILYKRLNKSITSSFDYFFTPDENCEYADMGRMLGNEYKGIYIRDYIRSKGFPITSEFWQ